MPEAVSNRQSYWFSKFFECLYFFIALAEVSFTILQSYLAKHIHNFNEGDVTSLFLIYCVVFVIVSAIYSAWWHTKQISKSFDSAIKHAWLRGILR
jgi:hypothetical protein